MLAPFALRVSLAVAAAGCVLAPTAPEVREGAPSRVLPPVTRPIPIDLEAGTGLMSVLEDLAEATGQHLLLDHETEEMLRKAPVLVGGPTEVPADEAYTFIEALLWQDGYAIAPVKGGTRPLLGVYWGSSRSEARPLHVVPEDVGLLEGHPALLARTIVHLPHLDVRQISTSLRALVTDADVQSMVPLGEHSVLLRSTGSDLADLVSSLLAADRAAAARKERSSEAHERQGGVQGR